MFLWCGWPMRLALFSIWDHYQRSWPSQISLITRQETTYGIQKETINNIKKKIKRNRQEYNQQKLIDIKSRLTSQQCRLNDINTEQGASTWLSTLPIEEEGYMLNKQEFWDLVNIRYGWPLSRTPRTCTCGNNFHIEHAFTCKKGGFITLVTTD